MAPDKKGSVWLPLLPAMCWIALLFYFSLLPGQKVPGFFNLVNDLIIHCGIYFVLTLLLFLGFTRFNIRKPLARGIGIGIVSFSVLYGGLLELIQSYFIPQRTGDWLDFLANTAGSLLAVLLLGYFSRSSA